MEASTFDTGKLLAGTDHLPTEAELQKSSMSKLPGVGWPWARYARRYSFDVEKVGQEGTKRCRIGCAALKARRRPYADRCAAPPAENRAEAGPDLPAVAQAIQELRRSRDAGIPRRGCHHGVANCRSSPVRSEVRRRSRDRLAPARWSGSATWMIC